VASCERSVTCVLVVEDDPLVRRAYQRVLAPDHHVTAVATGTEALAYVGGDSFDAIVSDLDVPGVSGMELLKTVRRLDQSLPFVVVTGCPSFETARDAVNLGAYGYLTKPVDPGALREVVLRASGHRRGPQPSGSTAQVGALGRAERAALDRRFDDALRQMWMAFQPIVSVRERRVIGFEALLRTDAPGVQGPPAVLALGERLGRLSELGRATRARIVERIPDAPTSARIFLNLHAQDLTDEDLYCPGSILAAHASRIVLEITERASLEDVGQLADRVARLRALGFSLAIDDLGAGYAGLTSIARLEPDVVKLDMSLVRGIDESFKKRQLVSSMARVCGDLGMIVVTEGVETSAERDTLVGLGCDVLQGYFFGRPQRSFTVPTL
jgi:EAL domain-containing protein (putative c-di-GMP-specific phosphodiesterase class I)/ActR/RegA family two-component response regulator